MNLFRWFRGRDTHPILLRLDLDGEACPSSVDVQAEWLPSHTHASTRLLSSSSMVLLPWQADAREAVLSIRAGTRVGRTVVTRDATISGSVLDVRLAPV